MSNEVTKKIINEEPEEVHEPQKVLITVADIDEQFHDISVNGNKYVSDNYVAPEEPEETDDAGYELSSTTVESRKSSSGSTKGEDVYAVELNNIHYDLRDKEILSEVSEVKTGLSREITNRTTADQQLLTAVNNEAQQRKQGDENLNGLIDSLEDELAAIQSRIDAVRKLIPEQASEENQLADKDYVNQSVATNTAYFVGTFDSVEELPVEGVTNNDYAFVITVDELGNAVYHRYKYNAEDGEWKFEYDLNTSSFTDDQWKAINSGATEEIIHEAVSTAEELTNHENNTTTAHGATSDATGRKIVIRDASGRAKVQTPVSDLEIANKYYVDEEIKKNSSIFTKDDILEIAIRMSGTVGELRYFPDTNPVAGFKYADGSIFLPDVYPEFFAWWKEHLERRCGYDNNGYPRLPDLRDMYIAGRGKGFMNIEHEMLPNLTGTFGAWNQWTGDRIGNGVFSSWHYQTSTGFKESGNDPRTATNMDASRVHTAYGQEMSKQEKPHVRPKSVTSYIFIKMM